MLRIIIFCSSNMPSRCVRISEHLQRSTAQLDLHVLLVGFLAPGMGEWRRDCLMRDRRCGEGERN